MSTNTHTPDEDESPVTAPATDNGRVGLQRDPVRMPSRAGRTSCVIWNGYRLIIGYDWAVYGFINDGRLTIFKGWKNFSQSSDDAVTALEAVAAETVSGAPAINVYLDESDSNPVNRVEDGEPLHVRTKNSAVPDLFPGELYVTEVEE